MKPQETKAEFIQLRAEGKSYTTIGKQLQISKDTCHKWERELQEEITFLKKEQLNELYESYFMLREARIKQLGDTLNNINSALGEKDLSEIAPEKLLDYKLKYMEALKGEYIEVNNTPIKETFSPEILLNSFTNLLNRVRAGEITDNQASKESYIMMNMLKTYETTKLEEKIDTINAVLEGR